jgi:hypothetical protein
MENYLRKLFDNLFFNLFRIFFLILFYIAAKGNFYNFLTLFEDNRKKGTIVKVEQIFFEAEEISAPVRYVYYIKCQDNIYKSQLKKNDLLIGSIVKFRNAHKKNVIYEVNEVKYAYPYDVWDILYPFLMILMILILIKTIKK